MLWLNLNSPSVLWKKLRLCNCVNSQILEGYIPTSRGIDGKGVVKLFLIDHNLSYVISLLLSLSIGLDYARINTKIESVPFVLSVIQEVTELIDLQCYVILTS